MKDLDAAYATTTDKTLDNTDTKVFRKALETEMTGLLMVHFKALKDDKPKLRTAVQATLKQGKAELQQSLSDDEQQMTVTKLLHPVLAAKVSDALKLR